MSKLRVGVVRGGPSSEYEVSLKSGSAVLNNLPENLYEIKDVYIDREGVWHLFGMPKDPSDVMNHLDVAFLALHGEYGEDGNIQRLFDRFGVPYTGSGAYSSALAMHKAETKRILKDLDVKFARHELLEVTTDIKSRLVDIIQRFAFPLIVKPVRGGSSVGLTLVQDRDGLADAVRIAFEVSPTVMIEEYIVGREATCGVVEHFRDEDVYAFMPVEIIPSHSEGLFDYKAKYSGESEEICPARFDRDINQRLQQLAKEVHTTMDLKHYSRSDFLVTLDGIYFLEVNTLPGLTEESLLPKSVKAVGSSLKEFLEHIIELAKR
jgi:D-alanine-D-alanine ligase